MFSPSDPASLRLFLGSSLTTALLALIALAVDGVGAASVFAGIWATTCATIQMASHRRSDRSLEPGPGG